MDETADLEVKEETVGTEVGDGTVKTGEVDGFPNKGVDKGLVGLISSTFLDFRETLGFSSMEHIR